MNARVCLAILLVCSLVLMMSTETNAAQGDGKGNGKETVNDKGSDTDGKGDVKDKNGMCIEA